MSSKEQLEIEKLRLELRYLKRNFVVQAANTIALISIAVVVFYFFQRPQVDSMEASRTALEKQQVANLIVSAQSIDNEDDKRRIIQILAQQWPQYDFVQQIARSTSVIAEKPAGQGKESSSALSETTTNPSPETKESAAPSNVVPLPRAQPYPRPNIIEPDSVPLPPSDPEAEAKYERQRERFITVCGPINAKVAQLEQTERDLQDQLKAEIAASRTGRAAGWGSVANSLKSAISDVRTEMRTQGKAQYIYQCTSLP